MSRGRLLKAQIVFLVGVLAFMIAKNAGVPLWVRGWVLPGDAADIGVTSSILVWALLDWIERGEHLRTNQEGDS